MISPYLAAVMAAAECLTRTCPGERRPSTGPRPAEVAAAITAMHLSWGRGFWEGLCKEFAAQARARMAAPTRSPEAIG